MNFRYIQMFNGNHLCYLTEEAEHSVGKEMGNGKGMFLPKSSRDIFYPKLYEEREWRMGKEIFFLKSGSILIVILNVQNKVVCLKVYSFF